MTDIKQLTFEFEQRPTIKGFPELRWTGKRPYKSTQYYPAQLRETYGESVNGWINKIFWGDNLQVMSHLLKDYRGKIDLIYIDPPFDSKEDYKKKIEVRGVGKVESDTSSFEEKQYGDIWSNDEYLQFMYERLLLMRELLSEKGSIFLHCDWHKVHHLRCLMDEVFGPMNFINEIVWCYFGPGSPGMRQFNRKHDNILWYSKTYNVWKFNANAVRVPHNEKTNGNFKPGLRGSGFIAGGYNLVDGKIPEDWWEMAIAGRYPNDGVKRVGYPTEKPYKLLERIIQATTDQGDIIADLFMGSGTTQAVAMKLGRRFIGADINLGAIQTTTKRLLTVAKNLEGEKETKYTGFEVYNVNNYDFFRNPVEARDLIIQALDVQPFPQGNIWDGELDGRMVKIMPVNRIATKADLQGIIGNLPYKTYEKRKEENPNQPVERITIVCMGHEADLAAALQEELANYKVDVQVVDILRDKQDLQLKRDSEAEVVREGDKLVIRAFYPMNLMQKLSLQKEYVEDWRQLVDSVMIDWNYDGVVMQPSVTDVPGKNEMVKGVYDIPEDAGTIKVKITDLLSESLELEVR
ncbi:site-specific DNA-methyltransferase [Megasphaera sp.]|uniref:site-specific DNA-methyltransferase n=1 Tax=Megasphaera sp. TaxID=2023260 RepID=UPI0025C4F763|nr:site-specific DNA-methyltransferase [Megasphaera sp.]MCF0153971.1 site-specific DNA-methyltransferase [Megasphaera sp.]MCF0257029.1 site-specific DNA-methyltransferase [Bacteroides heparinolyticus]